MKKNDPKKKRENRELAVVYYVFLAAFLALIAYLSFFLLARSERFVNNSYNRRIDSLAEKTIRGSILSEDGAVLAYTKSGEDSDLRIYPYGAEYAHAVGYTGNGKLGIEAAMNFYLLRSHSPLRERIVHALTGEKNQGDSVVTTLDAQLQKIAWEALGDYRGAVIVMEPKTGKVRAMVSKPDFDPNRIAQIYDELAADDEAAALLNRTTQGRYAPGSTFKLITTLEYVHENPDTYEAYDFTCTGHFLSDGKDIHCYNSRAHGEEDLRTSFANSCNSSYASLALSLDENRFSSLCDSMLFNQRIVFDLPTEKSYFTLTEGASDAERMETAIGQGRTLATPLQMLLIASAVDTGGTVHAPYLIEKTVNETGETVEIFAPEDSMTLMRDTDAALLKDYMRTVVTEGTGRGLLGDDYIAYGKTGTAEYNAAGDSHAWFVGFIECEGREDLAVAIVMEGAGAGSSFAVPAAKKIFDGYCQGQ